MPSGRKKGGTNKYWSAEEKEKILLECKEKGIGGTKAAKEYGISRSQFFNWTKAYLENGIKGLENKNYDMDKVIVYNDVREAYNFIRGINTKEDVYALFENDLPDTYNEK